MTNKKNYYVAVVLPVGLSFVTGVNNLTHFATWERGINAKKFNTLHYATEVANGLNANGFNAVVITSQNELMTKNFNK